MMKAINSVLFLCTLALATDVVAAGAAVEGVYRANGKDSVPAHALARNGDAYMDKPTIKLILTEKDAAKDDRPDFHAQMGDLGSALVVTLVKADDGYDVIGSEFAHPALKRSGASATGIVTATDVKIEAGQISGRLVAREGARLFDETLEIDLKFRTKAP